MSMEFWGVEVKAGEPLKVIPEEEKIIHISQAALGEGKKDKGNNFVPLRLKIDGQKFVFGNLSAERFPQLTFDLVFDREFELSHDWKNGSVYFCGYKVDGSSPDENEDSEFSSDDDVVEDQVTIVTENVPKVENMKPETSKASASKPEPSSKPKVMLVEPKKGNEFEDDNDDEDDDEDEDDEEDDSDDDEGLLDSDEDEEMLDATTDDEDTDDETTPKVGQGKKKVIESATKTPAPAKKAKLASPQKSGGKKGAHTATPYPSKQASKGPDTSTKSKDQTPKSGGQVPCKSCSKTFNSENALQSHTKAKHSGK